MPRLLPYAAIVALAVLPSTNEAVGQTGHLSLVVQDMFTGARLEATVTVRQGDKDYSERFTNMTGELPYGHYVVQVESDGFRTRRQIVGLYLPEVSVRVGLSPGISAAESMTKVFGRIDGLPSGEDFWIVLTPLLGTNGDLEVPRLFRHTLPNDGAFELAYVEPGHYLLAVVQGFPEQPRDYVKVLHTRHVKVLPKLVEVNVDLAKQ